MVIGMRKEKKAHSVRGRIIGIVLLCWFFPLFLMGAVMVFYAVNNQVDSAVDSYEDQVAFYDQICTERLNHAVALSRAASYDRTIVEANKKYRNGELTYDTANRAYTIYLQDKYQRDEAVSAAMLWFYDDPDKGRRAVYNSKARGSFAQTNIYWNRHHETVAAVASGLNTAIKFLYLDDALYLVRNLVDSDYTPVCVLVLRLNKEYCFESLNLLPMAGGIEVQIGDQLLQTKGEKMELSFADLDTDSARGSIRKKNKTYIYHEMAGTSYRIRTLAEVEDDVVARIFYGYQYIALGMIAALVLLMALLFRVFSRDVMKPVKILIGGSKEIEEGQLGYQISESAPNREFQYLVDSFNQMSTNLKAQFDQIYREEIALRDARIMALQSHINPHFMNNTLEIINWEARLAGDLRVTKMIEALSVLLDAAMDRNKQPEVRLAEEMRYVNAYLYITKERLGKRMTMEIDVPEKLLNYDVPRLILQPVIENAIEHGVVQCGTGHVALRAYREDSFLYLEIENSGCLTEEGQRKIRTLLEEGSHAGRESSGNIGIANVNQRLRILYGEPCGLKIWQKEKNVVLARLTIRVAPDDK